MSLGIIAFEDVVWEGELGSGHLVQRARGEVTGVITTKLKPLLYVG
jgi:hypothetical protein